MKPKVLCPRWGRCKAKKRCPLSKEAQKKEGLYVFGKCANKEVIICKKDWFRDWDEAIKGLEF